MSFPVPMMPPIAPTGAARVARYAVTDSASLDPTTFVVRFSYRHFGLRTPNNVLVGARVHIKGSVANMYIGHAASSGDLYDFATTPVAVLFNGATSVAAVVGASTDSDKAAFLWDGVSDILVAFETVGAFAYQPQNTISFVKSTYYKLGVTGEAATVNKSGYSALGHSSYVLAGLSLWGMPNRVQRTIICDGNSLTWGSSSHASTSPYPYQMHALLGGSAAAVWNIAIPGATTADRAAAIAQAEYHFVSGAVAVCWEATNDLAFNQNVASAISSYASWCAAVRALGYKVVAVTVLPRTQALIYAGFETDRQTVNTSIRANWSTYADALADVAAVASIGAAGASDDTTYYDGDKVHMNTVGYGVVASVIAEAVVGLL